MSIFSAMGHAFKEAVGVVGEAAHGVGQLIDGAESWAEHLFDGHSGAQAMSIAEMVA